MLAVKSASEVKVFAPATVWSPDVLTVGSVMSAEPSKLVPLIVRAVWRVVAVAALPVVFWFSVGNVQLAKSPEAGVPSAGVTSVGLSDKTTEPVPVEDVTPVPPLATGRVPVTPEVRLTLVIVLLEPFMVLLVKV